MTDSGTLTFAGMSSAQTAFCVHRELARSVTSLSPGWLAWWDDRAGLWRARRTGNFCEEPGGDRVYVLDAFTLPGLLAAIDQQASLDIADAHPEWRISRCEPSGVWHAEGAVVLEAWTAAALLHGISAALRSAA
jgi:sirohydrochlorin ferrochelatase